MIPDEGREPEMPCFIREAAKHAPSSLAAYMLRPGGTKHGTRPEVREAASGSCRHLFFPYSLSPSVPRSLSPFLPSIPRCHDAMMPSPSRLHHQRVDDVVRKLHRLVGEPSEVFADSFEQAAEGLAVAGADGAVEDPRRLEEAVA
jgi:hypothetical protein